MHHPTELVMVWLRARAIQTFKQGIGHLSERPIVTKNFAPVLKTLLEDVGMAVTKTTETRCRDGSVQARHVIQRLHK